MDLFFKFLARKFHNWKDKKFVEEMILVKNYTFKVSMIKILDDPFRVATQYSSSYNENLHWLLATVSP